MNSVSNKTQRDDQSLNSHFLWRTVTNNGTNESDLKGFVRKRSWPNQDSFPEFSWRNWKKKIMRNLNQDGPFSERVSETRALSFRLPEPVRLTSFDTLPMTHAKSEAKTTFSVKRDIFFFQRHLAAILSKFHVFRYSFLLFVWNPWYCVTWLSEMRS